MEQLHHVLKRHKLDEPGTFLRLACQDDGGAAAKDARWFCVGSLQKMKPVILHALIHLLPHASSESERHSILCLETWLPVEHAPDDRVCRISTSHRILHSLYGQRGGRGEDIAVCVWRSLRAATSPEFGNHFILDRKPDAEDVLGPSFKAEVQRAERAGPVACPRDGVISCVLLRCLFHVNVTGRRYFLY